MKLSISLFKTQAVTFDDCVKADYQGLKVVESKVKLPFDARAYFLTLEEKKPDWFKYINKYFDDDKFKTQGHGFLLILKLNNRYFGISFGYGYLAFNRLNLERNFGIKVVANTISKDKIKTIDSRTIDLVTRQQRVNLSEEASFSDFMTDITHEWIRLISGKPADSQFATSLTGSDSLRINTKIDFDKLAEKCKEIYDLYQSDEYKEKFPFLDYFAPIKADDPLRNELDAILNEKVNKRDSERISIALPEAFLDFQRLDKYKIYINKTFTETEELSLDVIYKFLNNNNEIEDPLNKIKIIGLDDQNKPCTKANLLYDFFVCETIYKDKLYAITAGEWFHIDNSYATSTRERLKEIDDITAELSLPDMNNGEKEGSYNKRVKSKHKDWHLLDCKNVTTEEPFQKIEVCDLLTPDNKFLCIKKMQRSATLSHLFSQGSVSATLLYDSKKYRRDIQAKTGLEELNLLEPKPTFVFCIATEKTGTITDELFLFSAINLLNQARTIKRLGYEVAVAKITIVSKK